jgi:hypothetical protein
MNHDDADVEISNPSSLGREKAVAKMDAMPRPYKNVIAQSTSLLCSTVTKEEATRTNVG